MDGSPLLLPKAMGSELKQIFIHIYIYIYDSHAKRPKGPTSVGYTLAVFGNLLVALKQYCGGPVVTLGKG